MEKQKNYFILENKAFIELKRLGYKPQGRTHSLKTVAVLKNGKILEARDYQTILKTIRDRNL